MRLPIKRTGRVRACLEFERRDCWIGVYWKSDGLGGWDVWICLLPCFPIHVAKSHYWMTERW